MLRLAVETQCTCFVQWSSLWNNTLLPMSVISVAQRGTHGVLMVDYSFVSYIVLLSYIVTLISNLVLHTTPRSTKAKLDSFTEVSSHSEYRSIRYSWKSVCYALLITFEWTSNFALHDQVYIWTKWVPQYLSPLLILFYSKTWCRYISGSISSYSEE